MKYNSLELKETTLLLNGETFSVETSLTVI